MNKEQVLRRLQAIINQLTCMDDEIFQSHMTENEFKIEFTHYMFGEPVKVDTKIIMKKIEVPSE